MLGLLIDDHQQKEITYIIQRELDELLLDLKDERIDPLVKESMKDRYQTLYNLFKRVATEQDCLKYIPK